MPGMCGQDLQVELKKGNSTLPVIVMTAFPDVMLEQRVLAAGAFCFLVKPFDANEMLRCVERALHINLN
jgi:FixJ family two-component response regulator